ncbi:hypothetical protein EJB05_36358 [Eragrostis curvula]|uniref:NAC domain-containing protein n=1 Tax=Eragrostis curvula TaxID=38414 RepID=A0A5J9UAF5_9POAL|nr:hypothetical protein EJB05_36358 [Eragrostis curvula]
MDSPAESSMEAAVKKHELVPQLQFPPGYRFVPTEEELVDVYLRCKIEGQKLPLDVVNEVTILEWQPGKLVETYKAYGENKWYFFTEREPSSSKKEKEPNRKVRVPGVKATWKATGSLTGICRRGKDGKTMDMVGTKRVLIYHSSDAEEDGKWSMHEYVLTSNSQIGQYALCSIQRKQHSDTEHKTGEATGSSKRKRVTTTTAMEPGKTTKRKKAISAKAEAAQKKKQEMASQHAPLPEAPLTPPKHDKQTPQQESPLPAYAPATSLPGVPLQQGYPSSSDGYLQMPMSAEYAQAFSYDQLCGDMAGLQFAMQQSHLTFCDQGEQSQQSLTWSQSISSDSSVDDAQYQAYQQQNYGSFAVPNQLDVYTGRYLRQNVDFFSGTQSNSSWELGQDHLIYQAGDELGGVIGGVQDTYAGQDFQSYEQQGLSAVVFGQETGYGSLGQLTKSFQGVAVASKGDDDNMASFSADAFLRNVDLYFRNALSVDVPQHKGACAQEGSTQALQNQNELQMLCGQQLQTSNNEHGCNGASSGCAVRS